VVTGRQTGRQTHTETDIQTNAGENERSAAWENREIWENVLSHEYLLPPSERRRFRFEPVLDCYARYKCLYWLIDWLNLRLRCVSANRLKGNHQSGVKGHCCCCTLQCQRLGGQPLLAETCSFRLLLYQCCQRMQPRLPIVIGYRHIIGVSCS